MSTQGKDGNLLHFMHKLNDFSCLFSCATTGEGLFEGLQWLSQNVKKRQQKCLFTIRVNLIYFYLIF